MCSGYVVAWVAPAARTLHPELFLHFFLLLPPPVAKERFHEHSIFTNCGPVLLCVNPYEELDCFGQVRKTRSPRNSKNKLDQMLKSSPPSSSFQQHIISDYAQVSGVGLPAHAYASAQAALDALRSQLGSQNILFLGELGSGKSRCFMETVEYLISVNPSTMRLHQQVLEANTLLHGNARLNRKGKAIFLHSFFFLLRKHTAMPAR